MKYYTIVKTERNMYAVETITVEGKKVISIEKTESTFLPIAFDQLRRKTGEAYFEAVQESVK